MRASAPNASRSPQDISANTTPAGAQETEAVPVLDLALFAYSAAVTVGILADIKGLLDSWATVYKVLYIAMAVVTVASTAIGFMTAGCLAAPMVRNRTLSAWCARFGSVVATALLVVAIACTIGRSGCVAGAIAGAAIAAAMAVVWVLSGPAAASPAVSAFWDRLRRGREEPESPQPTTTTAPAAAINRRWYHRLRRQAAPASPPQPAPSAMPKFWARP